MSMVTKVFVGSLPKGSKPEELRHLFESYGVVVQCDINNRCGFVHMETPAMADNAIIALNQTNFKNQTIVVELGREHGRPMRGAIQQSGGRGFSSRGRGSFDDRNTNQNYSYNDSGPIRNDNFGRPRGGPYKPRQSNQVDGNNYIDFGAEDIRQNDNYNAPNERRNYMNGGRGGGGGGGGGVDGRYQQRNNQRGGYSGRSRGYDSNTFSGNRGGYGDQNRFSSAPPLNNYQNEFPPLGGRGRGRGRGGQRGRGQPVGWQNNSRQNMI